MAFLVTEATHAAVITGSGSGQMCLWGMVGRGSDLRRGGDNDIQLRLRPRVMLLGHTSPTVWSAVCLFERSMAIVSLCRGGVLNVWDPMDGRCLLSAMVPLLPTTTAGAVLPGLAHAAVGGEGGSLIIVQLSTMAVRRVLAPLNGWCVGLVSVGSSIDLPETLLLCLDGSGAVNSWLLALDAATGAVEVLGAPLRCAPSPPVRMLSRTAAEVGANVLSVAFAAAAALSRACLKPYASAQAACKVPANPFDDKEEIIFLQDVPSTVAIDGDVEVGHRTPLEPSLPLCGQRYVQMSSDGSLLLLIASDGAVWLHAIPSVMRRRRAPATPATESHVLPASSAQTPAAAAAPPP